MPVLLDPVTESRGVAYTSICHRRYVARRYVAMCTQHTALHCTPRHARRHYT